MADPTADLGPLPVGDRQDTLQQLSLKALRKRLPEDKFLFRDERVDDKGVDVVLEAKVEFRTPKTRGGEEVKHQFTNCRAQAQLKSTDRSEQNEDGSISYSIETSNLNYLLNGSSPIYLLWIAPADQVRYAWARDEWQRLDAENPDWKKQRKFTVRFRHVLDPKAIKEIHERILREARLTRRVYESLSRSAPSERVVLSIDSQTLESTDPKEIHQLLTSSGMAIVSAGYGRLVSDWVEVLNPDARREPRIQLVAAYAQTSLGRYHEAIGSISQASMRRAELSSRDQQFLDQVFDACHFQIGQIDLRELMRRQEDRAQRQGGAALLEHKFEALRQDWLEARDPERRSKLLAQLRAMVAKMPSHARHFSWSIGAKPYRVDVKMIDKSEWMKKVPNHARNKKGIKRGHSSFFYCRTLAKRISFAHDATIASVGGRSGVQNGGAAGFGVEPAAIQAAPKIKDE